MGKYDIINFING